MPAFKPVGLILVMALVLFACSKQDESPQDELAKFVEAAAAAAESRDSGDLGELLHRNYLDQKGSNKQQLIKALRAYFFRYKHISLFTRIDKIELISDNQATVSLHVAMKASSRADGAKLLSLNAQIYQFELQLIRDSDWLLQHATWSPVIN